MAGPARALDVPLAALFVVAFAVLSRIEFTSGAGFAVPTQVLFVPMLLPLLPGDKTPVRFSFTPLLGAWTVDDVYVDPWRMR